MKIIEDLKDIKLYIESVISEDEANYNNLYDKVYGLLENIKNGSFLCMELYDDYNGNFYCSRIINGVKGDYIDVIGHRYYLNEEDLKLCVDYLKEN